MGDAGVALNIDVAVLIVGLLWFGKIGFIAVDARGFDVMGKPQLIAVDVGAIDR